MDYNFDRFIDAQETMYTKALEELQAGKKRSHWIWYIFPQTSKMEMGYVAKRFSIRNLEEARAYYKHPVLGTRLRECTKAVLAHKDVSLLSLFGTELDVMKFKSSILLFSHVDEKGIFQQASLLQ